MRIKLSSTELLKAEEKERIVFQHTGRMIFKVQTSESDESVIELTVLPGMVR